MTIGAVLINLYIRNDFHATENTTEWIQSFWNTRISLPEYIKQATILFRSDCNLVNPPSWYLTSEIEMMLVFPVLFLLFKHFTISTGFIIIAISGVINNPHALLISSYLIGFMFHAFEQSIKISRPTLMLIIGFLLLNVRNIIPATDVYIVNNLFQLSQCIGGALIILTLKQTQCRLFNNKIMIFLGNISYEFFVIHFIILMAIFPFVNNWYCCVILTLVISISFAYIINRFFSKYQLRIN